MPKDSKDRQNNGNTNIIRNMDGEIHAKLQKIDDRQRADHDTLIELKSKTDLILTNTNDLKDGLSKRLGDVESKVRYFSDLEIAINPKQMKQDLDSLIDWKEKFGFTWKLVATVSAVISAVIGFILGTVSQIVSLMQK